MTDLSHLQNKQPNPEQQAYVQENAIPANQTLTAKEFVDNIVKPIIELQDEVADLKQKSVHGVKQGITTYYPDAANIVTLPGADTQVGVYLNLHTNKIVSVTGQLKVGIRAISTTGGSNTGEVVEVQVMTAPTGSTDWVLGGKFMLNTKSFSSDAFDEVDITSFVGVGTHDVQLIATGQRTGVTGYSDTFTAVLTTMRLVCQQNYQTPIDTLTQNTFPLAYTVYGSVQKTLHIKLSGSVATEELIYELSDTDDSVTIRKTISDDTAHGYLTHGVHRVEAWLTADDGQGSLLESDHLVNRFMVVNRATEGADFGKPYLLIQNLVSQAVNFVQTKICDYAIYSPSINEDGTITADGKNIDIMFLMTAYARDYESEHPEEYFRMEQSVTPGTQNSLNVTVEIEGKDGEEKQQTFNAYFRAYRVNADGSITDMLYDAQRESSVYVEIDNRDSFAPMSGADFVLNPKVRNNTESNPQRILNARKNNALIPSVWSNFGMVNDGWVTNLSDGQKVLRIPAGSKVKFAYNPFSQFLTTPDSSMTLELDFAVRNMTDEDEEIIGINEMVDGQLIGLTIRPITGVLFTASNVVEDESDFRWQEDKRVHITINIHNSITPDNGDAYKPTADTGIDVNATKVALIRVFVNDSIEREMKYSITNRNEFLTEDVRVNALGDIFNGFSIGSSSADIDIYSIRCYKSMQLEADDVVGNWIASLPSSEEKLEARKQNAIKSAGKVDIEKVKALGKRCLVWHGSEPYYYAADAQKGWWEILQYNADGTLNRDYSGSICKETKSLKMIRQGSTSNTYYYSNGQTKTSDVEDTIKVAVTDLHSSIVLGEPYAELDKETKEPTGRMLIPITGGNLGKNFPIANDTADYEYVVEGSIAYVIVPDGWIDGNNKYRGIGFCVAPGTPMAQKLVNKINYASPMQSHLCGCTRAFSDLHTAVVGKNSLQDAYDKARVAKYTEPFYYFVQSPSDPSPVYRGPSTFGAGKMDKPTWGYVKKKHPMFMMVEGSDNNYTMTDFRCPWDSKVTYNPDDEGWMRAGLQHWDFDAGATDKFNEGTADEYEVPKPELTALWANAYNFIYLHSPMLMYYAGTFNAFKESKAAENTAMRYWCTEGEDAFKLKRYDDVLKAWVDAGLENSDQTGYDVFDLTTHEFTASTYAASANKNDFDKLNSEFISAIVAHFKKYLGFYFKPSSVRFHYCFINHLMAATDNCSKNTYYVCDPKAVSVTIDGETRTCYLFEMHQDDVDTIGPTDNNGRSTKPYYIDRMHPYSDKDASTSCYEGNNSAFFNLCELAWEGTLELQSTMKKIFDAMSDIMSTNTDSLLDFDGSATNTVWGFFHKYFFNIQRYFSGTAYNEAARIRYEYPAMINYTSRGPGARGIAPITQSVGPQLQSEIQYYRRRLVLMASYAAWGDFYDGGKTHKIGISEAADSFPLQAFHLPDSATSNTEYKFTVKPHQYIYPTGVMGQTAVDPHVRLRPGQEYVMSLGTTTSNDTGMSLLGINYYTSIGNIGDLSVSPNITVTINGKRLTEFTANPTKLYEDMDTGDMVPAFRPGSINVTSTLLKRVSLNGCKQIGGTLDTSSLNRVEEIDIRNTNINNVKYPSSTAIKRIYLGRIRSVELSNMPNLEVFSMTDYSALTSFEIGENVPHLDTYSIVGGAYLSDAPLKSIMLNNVNWDACDINVLTWLSGIQSLELTGTIAIYEPSSLTPAITFDGKQVINNRFGNVDDPNSDDYRGLKLSYIQRALTTLSVNGNFYNDGSEVYKFSLVPNSQYANDYTSITWSVTSPTKGGEWSINAKTGELTVTKLSALLDSATITAVARRYVDGTYTSIVASKTIEIYDRPAKLGDYVFADGTFGDTDDSQKTVVGICCYVAPRNASGDIVESLFDSKDKQQRLMVSTQNITASANSGTQFTTWQWGSYSSTTDATNGLFYKDDAGKNTAFNGVNQGLASGYFYDIQTIANITSGGLTADPTNQNSTSYIGDNNLRDEVSDEGILNGGFRNFSAVNTSAGDGFAYGETATQKQARTLDPELAALAGSEYHDGDMVNSGYAKTLKIIRHRNAILNAGVPEVGISSLGIPSASDSRGTTELDDLANCMDGLRTAMQSNGETNFAKWSQLYYPAASAAYAYQPTVLKRGELLADKFKSHNWFLPPQGLLARLYWYHSQGVSHDRNIFKRSIADGKFTGFSASYHWSSTEYSAANSWFVNFSNGYFGHNLKSLSTVVRAVAAF